MTITSETQTMAYAGSLSCGCIVAVAIDSPDHKVDTALEIANWVKEDWEHPSLILSYRAVADLKADPAFFRDCGGQDHTS